MSIAVGIGVLLMSGVVLSGPEQSGDDFGLGNPPRETSMPGRPAGEMRPEGPRFRSSGGPTDPNAAIRYGTPQRRGGQEVYRDSTMPIAPTDPSLGGPDSPLASPTESSGDTQPGFGPRRVGPAASGRPAPSRAMPWGGSRTGQPQGKGTSAASARSQQLTDQMQSDRLTPGAGVSAAAPRVAKPYANYSPPPAVSPYQNLFRNDTSNGTLSNYYNFVKPQVDQRQTNLTFGGEIRGIQHSQQLQRSAVQRLGKSKQTPGTNAPEFFQNYGPYFPALH